MSKNVQMRSSHIHSGAVVAPHVPTVGTPSLVQGVYGARGNLELLACDPADGLWVFWFDSDLPSDARQSPDVAPGEWSSGLRFARGGAYTAAQILQGTLGPDHLEVLALTPSGELESWWWSPERAFQRRPEIVARGIASFEATHRADGVVDVAVRSATALPTSVVGFPDGYPHRRWESAPLRTAAPAEPDVAALRLLDAAGIDRSRVGSGTARVHLSSRAGGTREVSWRDAEGRIRHLGLPVR